MQPIDFNGLDTTVHGPLRLGVLTALQLDGPHDFTSPFTDGPDRSQFSESSDSIGRNGAEVFDQRQRKSVVADAGLPTLVPPSIHPAAFWRPRKSECVDRALAPRSLIVTRHLLVPAWHPSALARIPTPLLRSRYFPLPTNLAAEKSLAPYNHSASRWPKLVANVAPEVTLE
jgi:hypothetical protein